MLVPPRRDDPTIRIAAALITRLSDGAVLLVRKHTSLCFIQPGGKIVPGETPEAALIRELREEIGLSVRPGDAVWLGQFTAAAANEPGHQVQADIFGLAAGPQVAAGGEIAELAWVAPDDSGDRVIADLTRIHMFPLARRLFAEATA